MADDVEDTAGAPVEQTFTQKDLDRVAAREKRQGADHARREVLRTLGVDDPARSVEELAAELRSRFQAQQEAEQRQLTAGEQQQRQAEQVRREAEALRQQAAGELRAARIERALTAAGCPAERVQFIRLDVPPDADADAVREAVDRLKIADPGLFGPVDSGQQVPSSTVTGPPPVNGVPPRGVPGALGRAEAQRRFGLVSDPQAS